MEQLKKCPFCGGEAKIITQNSVDECYGVRCTKVGCVAFDILPCYSEKAEAITAWNTRKPMERIVARLDKKVKFVDDKITQKIHWGHQAESDQQFMNGVMYAIGIVKEEM